ncbi:MAG: M3 family oligoendopeptidase, partial [Bacilli bacterium]|nr:M3 family oligoendopeptidase [Bacilli bacterium]
MKFKDYPYKRPDMEYLEKEFSDVISTIENAKSASKQIEAIDHINSVRKSFETMSSLCEVRLTLDTTDAFYENEQNFFDEMLPLYRKFDTELSKALFKSPYKGELIKKYGKQLFALIEANIKSFSPEIIEELQEENRLLSEYRKLAASAKILFDGKINNLSQMGPYHISSERTVRKEAEAATMGFFEENEA